MDGFPRSCALLSAMLAVAATGARAVDQYVREGATGSPPCTAGWGDDQACPSLPAVLQRGDAYYVADGDYGGYVFDDAVAGTQYITIRKATVADHGTNTGWQDSYGDGQALFSGTFVISTDYWEFDGAIGGGPGSWETGHGFKIKVDSTGAKAVRLNSGASHLAFRHVEMEHQGPYTADANADLVYATTGNSDLIFSHCYLHDVCRVQLLTRGVTGMVLEYSKISRNGNAADGIHREAISDSGSDDVVIRYNLFEDITNTGIVVVLSSGCTDPTTGGGTAENWQVYGNVFTRTDWGGIGAGAIQAINCEKVVGWQVHNNTFVNLRGSNAGVRYVNSFDGSAAYNNLFYGNIANQVSITGTSDYSWFGDNLRYDDPTQPSTLEAEPNRQLGSGDPFVDLATRDFRLASGTDAGRTLPPPFDVDMYGNVRGADGVWDRGAYEFVGWRPAPPVNLRAE